MRKSCIGLLVASTILLAACGSPNNNNVTGNWSATLTPGSGVTVSGMAFNTTLATNSDSSVTGSSLSITSSNGCMPGNATQSVSFTVSGTTNAFVLDLKDTSVQAGNDLTLRGTMADGKITGQWGLASTDVNCSGFGTFTMTKVGSPYPSRGGH